MLCYEHDLQMLLLVLASTCCRLSTTVLNGLKAIFTNFTGVAGQLSGPVAIVAAGSEIAKTDSAGLFQVCGVRWGMYVCHAV
jgi:hypothetical protein